MCFLRKGFKVQITDFREEYYVPKEDIPMEEVRKEQVPSSDSGFREGRPSNRFQVQILGLGKEDFLPKEGFVSKEDVPSSDSGFRVDFPKEECT
ncbi:hypothetical protein PCOAH_00020530 [Plasmodium coatneyi]|uniref:SICA antigen n=1 Tax=Plasmodium coatneyi TaxID=208452 RepID=A0A1B1DYA8_9APIC|nr:hypothetical protein PCOAH_00020530 [Plasmodium coatneyi]ANQ07773.1 hypothetical protein PCOAH_00020530 [Plasmodium coatneyi]